MTIFSDEPEQGHDPWTPYQFREAKRMLWDLMELADSKGLDPEEVVRHHKSIINGTDFNKWCNGLALKYDRIEKGK